MKTILLILTIFVGALTPLIAQKTMKPLTSEERRVILNKATEPPFSGIYYDYKKTGTYVCRQCGAPLYSSDNKFDAGCGWPSFDDEIKGAVRRVPDADGERVEIVCARCGAHLGHVFEGEHFTPKNTRHCVNSLSLSFEAAQPTSAVAYFAGGCFWGVEYLFEKQKGVLDVESGYMGGNVSSPTYEQVCCRNTGHVETVRVTYDPSQISYETLAKFFFEIHDPTQSNRQGPDVGEQYRSEIFYTSPAERLTAEKLIVQLRAKGYDVMTILAPASRFWRAEEYHQDYYRRKGSKPYCHLYTPRF